MQIIGLFRAWYVSRAFYNVKVYLFMRNPLKKKKKKSHLEIRCHLSLPQ